MSQTHEELEQEVIAQYRTMMRGLKATMGQAWMQIDLTLPQMRTLLVLAEGPLVIGQIAQRLGVGLSTGGHLVDRLVQAGLAERAEDAGDRRRTVSRLTPSGEEIYGQLRIAPQRLQSLLQEMDDTDLNALLQGISALNRIIRKQASEQPIVS